MPTIFGRPPTISAFSRGEGGGFDALSGLTGPGALDETHALLHLAWSSLPATSEQNPHRGINTTCRCCKKSWMPSPLPRRTGAWQFVFFSSGGTVYGNAPGRASSKPIPACRSGVMEGPNAPRKKSSTTYAIPRSRLHDSPHFQSIRLSRSQKPRPRHHPPRLTLRRQGHR